LKIIAHPTSFAHSVCGQSEVTPDDHVASVVLEDGPHNNRPSGEQEGTSSVAAPSRISLRYKSSYLKDKIIESKNDPLKIRGYS